MRQKFSLIFTRNSYLQVTDLDSSGIRGTGFEDTRSGCACSCSWQRKTGFGRTCSSNPAFTHLLHDKNQPAIHSHFLSPT